MIRRLLTISLALLSTCGLAAAEMTLTGDFVEVGRAHAGVSRSQSSVELVNISAHVLDVRFGRGATRLAPGERLLVRSEGGDVELNVKSPTLPGEELSAILRVEPAVHHSLALAYEDLAPRPRLIPSLEPSPETAQTSPVRSGSSQPAASTPVSLTPQTSALAKTAQPKAKTQTIHAKRKRSGRVDIGRKRKKNKR